MLYLLLLQLALTPPSFAAEAPESCEAIVSLNRNSDVLIAAPHGGFDLFTDQIVQDFCETVPWDCLIVSGLRTFESPVNVNRPTEGLRRNTEIQTPRATQVFKTYLEAIERVRGSRLRLYVEIHGNRRPKSVSSIEIATVGISLDQARQIQALLNEALGIQELNQFDVKVEGLDPIHYQAGAAKSLGTLALFQPALHIELPWELRGPLREKLVRALAIALPRIASEVIY